ncbi:uncharacterized protein cubi_02239 [Cryptosporidium ubiquitum]|uniref:Uncharacterized protein n=1 Tax=Cryptosporidium ubiquitum TaxID=857276 RepID=A0A1J4MFK3_9CRYT|nr:uncharacterized protein cubi_02239 [Cryptosporidium ubiquitum]OII73008.1 hypothetical protein cubi_02239 [Cryptosporidium ubiquitum]
MGLAHKLAIDKFLQNLEFQNLQVIEDDFLYTKLKVISKDVFESLKEVSEQENFKYTLQKYKTKIKQIAENLYKDIKSSLDIHFDLLNNLNSKFQEINIEIVNGDYRSEHDQIYRQNLLNYLNSGFFDQSIQFLEKTHRDDKTKLIDQIRNLFYIRYESQSSILKSVILLHKLATEIELTKIVYLYSKNRTKSDEFETMLQKFVKMLHLLTSFEFFLNGCFQSPHEISITKIMNLNGDSEILNSKDTRFVIYPNLEYMRESCNNYYMFKGNKYVSNSNKEPIVFEDNKQENYTSSHKPIEYQSFNQSDTVKGIEINDESDLLFNDANKLLVDSDFFTKPKQSPVFDQTYYGRQKIEIDIISPILSAEPGINTNIEENCYDNNSTQNFNINNIEQSHFIDKNHETLKINDEEVKFYIKKKNIEQINKNTGKLGKKIKYDSKLEYINHIKCLEFQYVCILIRHLDDEEMMELDKNLFPFGAKLPLEKDNNLIWSTSESLVDNFGARKRLIELVSQKIIHFKSSVNRSNTDPLMNTGEEKDDKVSFYRGKHLEILSILIALKKFLDSNNSNEIASARLNFIEKFVPLIRRPSTKKSKFSDNLESKDKNIHINLSKDQKGNRMMKLRSFFENDKKLKYRHPLEGELSSPNMDETINEPSLYELCTRFIMTLSITKSVKSFNDNSYKFAQKVCSMIFEQPIHNILSTQDYAWLTGFTLVRTVNSLVKQHNLPEEILIDHKNALRALNHSFSQKIYNFHQACTQSLVSQKSTAIYRNNISLHNIKPIMKISCAEYFGISVFLYEN